MLFIKRIELREKNPRQVNPYVIGIMFNLLLAEDIGNLWNLLKKIYLSIVVYMYPRCIVIIITTSSLERYTVRRCQCRKNICGHAHTISDVNICRGACAVVNSNSRLNGN